MNMNQYNQVTVPLALMNAVMNAMQTQPQHQQAGGVPNTINGLTVPQQAAYPNFLLQGPQLQPVPGPSSAPQLGGQQWPVYPAFQAANALQPSGPHGQSNATAKQPTVEEIVAGVVAAMKTAPQEATLDKFSPDDERILVNALRKAKAEGLTPLQGFSKLDQVSNHTSAAWKDHFIRHVERLCPKIYPQAYANPSPTTSKSAAGSSRSTRTPAGPSTPSLPRRPVTGGDASDSEQSSPDEDAAVQVSATHRSKRGAPPVEYHEEVRIPHLPPGVKPKPPRRDPQHGSTRFTKEDKIFFIQYLKYRLHKGPVPTKEKLYRELAKQTPHHNADSWKRHWDNACTLPNEIYIQARKRINSSQKEPAPPIPHIQESASRAAKSSVEEDESGEEEEEEEEATSSELSDGAVRKPRVSRALASTATGNKANRRRGGPRHRITDEEIRAMARYIAEKRKCDGWETLPAHVRFAEFVNRPEGPKRTMKAWIQITYTRSKDINAYVQEYEAGEAQTSAGEDRKPSVSPAADRTANSQPAASNDGRNVKGRTTCSKRGLNDDDDEPKSEGSMASTQKRAKLAEPESIVISD